MILVYHDINFISKNENTVNIFIFILQILILKVLNKNFVKLKDYQYSNYNNSQVVITFDDGLKRVKILVLPILRIFKIPFTLFVCDKFIKKGDFGDKHYLSTNDIVKIAKFNIDIQYHSKSHLKLTDITDSDILEDEIRPPLYLKELNNGKSLYFAYPYWQYNDKIINIVQLYYNGARSGRVYADNTRYALNGYKTNNNILEFIQECRAPKSLAAVERERERERERVIRLRIRQKTFSLAA